MSRLESMAERMLREAIEAGEFDNLPGKGQPVDLSENPFADPDLRVVHKLLRDAGFAPAWIEERKDIDATFEATRQILTRAWKIYRPGGVTPGTEQRRLAAAPGDLRAHRDAHPGRGRAV